MGNNRVGRHTLFFRVRLFRGSRPQSVRENLHTQVAPRTRARGSSSIGGGKFATPDCRASHACARIEGIFPETAPRRSAPGKAKNTGGKVATSDSGKARDKAGKDFGVSGKSVDYAKRVIEHGEHFPGNGPAQIGAGLFSENRGPASARLARKGSQTASEPPLRRNAVTAKYGPLGPL